MYMCCAHSDTCLYELGCGPCPIKPNVAVGSMAMFTDRPVKANSQQTMYMYVVVWCLGQLTIHSNSSE